MSRDPRRRLVDPGILVLEHLTGLANVPAVRAYAVVEEDVT